MHVVIVGAGEIGWFLAQRLGAENHDIVVVETNPSRAAAISEQLDVQVVFGSGSSPGVLLDAGIEHADLLAAVTERDEVNMIASLIAKQHGVAKTVCRLQSEELRTDVAAELVASLGADVVIDPDADTADEILELVHLTGADEVYPMANGELVVIGAEIAEGAPAAGMHLSELARKYEPNWEFLFGAVTRGRTTTIPRGDQQLCVGDHVRVLVTKGARPEILNLLGLPGGFAKRVMVLGGGAIGTRVAQKLEAEGVDVVLIERDLERARELSEMLKRTLIVVGDVTDTDLLAEEGAGKMDAVIATTGEDASNVLSCAYAGAAGATFTVAVLHRLALLPLVRQFGINAALSPRTASANSVLRQLRGGASAVTTFLESDAEIDEFVIEAGSQADGAQVKDLHLPTEVLLGAVIREGDTAKIVRGDTVLRANDHVVVFATPDALTDVVCFFVK